ncbi:bifunctional ornithine acetyltransferase/N-acety lglutamate synthase [Desulfonema ishimotonii]|uniref:Arginine biosynthesis bifunctional protein ArgJ n=1 Tax=Desulfonema ishimotonii TaxID=45657 RepID=A0A401FWF0_9BACT|nr:bifunctional glutamate N-acetyltransferase/amino-acid acetyltransferase ArgJ [Desulfonema ishimotonii]GBC61295.1 bifunctional ornithine acetyltransferase/N-acety lglutamate synthase [Desulfonema ishimotonii]
MQNIMCKGFRAAGVTAGLKKDGKKDLGLIFSEVPASVAGVFTRNRVQAAPVLLDRERVKSGKCQAVIVNSGNANCCTGEQGMTDAVAMTRCAASALEIGEALVCVASTGVIGQPMPVEKVERAVPGLAEQLRPEGISDLAEAILTTDLVSKIVTVQGELGGKSFTVTGVAKGSGMIRPDMATMLCFVCTDLEASPEILKKTLSAATDRSFNRISVDGDTSTNDTVLLMANGLSGAKLETAAHQALFQKILDDMLLQLAKMIVRDGEGVTKMVEILVRGAVTDADALAIADTVGHSPLVKTALFGEDANWGRIIAAAGRAGVPLEPEKTDILFDDVMMCENGMTCGDAAEAEATKVMKTPEFTITVDLKMGTGTASVITCDFSVEYVKINADYRS